jgi:hypothetical protein
LVYLGGDDTVSTGQRVTKWTARECETRRIGVIPVEEAKL